MKSLKSPNLPDSSSSHPDSKALCPSPKSNYVHLYFAFKCLIDIQTTTFRSLLFNGLEENLK